MVRIRIQVIWAGQSSAHKLRVSNKMLGENAQAWFIKWTGSVSRKLSLNQLVESTKVPGWQHRSKMASQTALSQAAGLLEHHTSISSKIYMLLSLLLFQGLKAQCSLIQANLPCSCFRHTHFHATM